ncbi:hypothetical protein Agub_g6709, partial [Astrephomene gubernaculifera]
MSFPQWKGLWDWSMKYADGTGASRFRPEDVDPEKMKWLEEALKHYMIDFSARMRDIKATLERDTSAAASASQQRQQGQGQQQAGGSDQGPVAGGGEEERVGAAAGSVAGSAAGDLEEREALLEELMDIVSSIDYARDLHKIGGLPVLLELLASPHPSLRWRTAEVV